MANPPSRKHAWRDAAAPASTSRPVEEAWRHAQAPTRHEPPWWKSRRARFAFVTSALLLVTAGIIAVVLWWHPVKPMHLVVIGAGYKDNLFVPHNVSGRNGVDGLIQLAKERNNWDGERTEVPLDSDPDVVKDKLVSFFGEKPKTVVIFVSAHGVARSEEGGLAPCLVPQDDNLRDGATLYRLDRLLDALAALPEETKKLLLVDATQVSAHWPLGELHNDFARALAGRAKRIDEIPNLVVISSSDKDQHSWVSPEWGQTYFAHFVIEGLKGAADVAKTGNHNSRVDALELFHYVRAEVERWAWHNREQLQTPVLFGDDERARKMELVSCGDYQANNSIPEADDEKHKKDYEDLQKAWEKCRELRRESPYPAVYAPHLWRRYLAMLLRAEQLLRAGDSVTAKKMLGDLQDLQKRIVQSRSLELLKSAQLTLAMPAALGDRLTKEQGELDRIEGLWKESAEKKDHEDKDYEKARSALLERAGKNPLRQQVLRAALAGRVMRNVATAPEDLLTYGRQSLEKLDAVAPDCRPAEVHYLMMLRPEIEAGKSSPIDPLLEKKRWPLLQKSLEVRLLAEHAALGLGGEEAGEKMAAYSEQVLPWIRETIENADKPRRLGQDLLFTSDPKKWDEADRLLGDAKAGYLRAQKLAVEIRRALAVRDRVHAELPYYTHWVAERGSEHVEDVVGLWSKLHDLGRRLEKPAAGEAAIAQAAELDKRRDRIAKDFEEMEKWVRDSAANDNPHHQDRWHEIEAALAVPFLEPDERMNLIKASRDISRDLFVNPPKEGAAGEGDRKQARELAARQGRLALAVLGDDWPESAKIKTELDNAVEETWRRALTRAGEAVGQLLNRLPEEADKLCERAAGMENLNDAAASLRSATRNARTIEGAAVDVRMQRDPVGELRRLHLHHLLCWQAHRTFLDWWAELKQGLQTPPYYQRAAEVFLKDAEELIAVKSAKPDATKPNPRLKLVDDERELLRNSPKVVVEWSKLRYPEDFHPGPARFDLTDEDSVEWSFRLRGPKAETVPGYPVVWVEADSGLRVDAEEAQRRTVEFDRSFPAKIVEDSSAGRPASGVARHRVEGFFRGHRSRVTTEVFMPIGPNLVVSMPPLRGLGRVAVQTKKNLYALYGAKNAAIALVLDLSGSMKSVRPGDKIPRYKKAIKALESVLDELPDDVTVSLLVFGAEESKEFRDKGGIDVIWKPHPWRKDELKTRMKAVKDLTPAYGTPLIRSIWMASKEKLLPRKLTRSIVVITDGGDSNFYSPLDNDLKGGEDISIKDFLGRKFGESDIQISVVGYEVNKKELSPAELRGYKEFRPALKAIKGQYYDAESNEQLTEYLTRSLMHMYFQVYPDEGVETGDLSEAGQNISQIDKHENPRWVPLRPNTYRIRIPSVRSLQQRIDIRPGDALLLDLVPGLGDRPEFRRSVYAESDYITREHAWYKLAERQERWLLAALQNQQLPQSKRLQIMATLEKDPDPTRPPKFIQQIHPRWFWFEVPSPDAASKTPPPLRVASLPDYPAPAWGLEVSDWPLDGPSSTLKVWWTERSIAPHGQLLKGPNFKDSPVELGNRPWPIDPQLGKVVVESVELKRCQLQVEGGQWKDVNCLMVRLSYPPDKGPFFVRLPNQQDREHGVEDRFYTSAGKYTGLFWAVTSEDARKIDRLDLFSVAELKKASLHVEKLELGRPNANWRRPQSARPKSEEAER